MSALDTWRPKGEEKLADLYQRADRSDGSPSLPRLLRPSPTLHSHVCSCFRQNLAHGRRHVSINARACSLALWRRCAFTCRRFSALALWWLCCRHSWERSSRDQRPKFSLVFSFRHTTTLEKSASASRKQRPGQRSSWSGRLDSNQHHEIGSLRHNSYTTAARFSLLSTEFMRGPFTRGRGPLTQQTYKVSAN